MQSMLRLMQDWHRSLGVAPGSLTWALLPLRPMVMEEQSQGSRLGRRSAGS